MIHDHDAVTTLGNVGFSAPPHFPGVHYYTNNTYLTVFMIVINMYFLFYS